MYKPLSITIILFTVAAMPLHADWEDGVAAVTTSSTEQGYANLEVSHIKGFKGNETSTPYIGETEKRRRLPSRSKRPNHKKRFSR